jgi:hypothetical protein
MAPFVYVCACGPTVATIPPRPPQIEPSPSPDAVWPWKRAVKTEARKGVTRWFVNSTADGTDLELFEFDFSANPKLTFEIYDQDEDDSKPFDNRADYFPRGVGQVTKHLNEQKRGKVVAAWNGLFFGYDRGAGSPQNGYATHIGPVVLGGKVYHNVGRHRWTFGVKRADGRATFKVLHLPSKALLAENFDFAADGAQCLILDGEPKKLEPFPGREKSAPSTPDQAGHIAFVDYWKTSRTSLAWNKDSSRLYVLIVNEPDTEVESKLALKYGKLSKGGWTLSDLQRFWRSFGAWGAINSDGGIVTQSLWLRPDGKYELLPSRLASPSKRLEFDHSLTGTPAGGSLLTFYVAERD